MKRSIPPLNALKAFEAAARHSSFRDAANELHVSHSAISHQIKHLEDFLGIELFLRKAREVELTAAGKSYYPLLRGAFDSISDATKVLLRPKAENVLTVQMYSTFAIRWLVPHLENFYAENPELQVRLLTSQQDPEFELGDIDLGLYIGPRTRMDIHYEPLFTPNLFPVCSPKLLTGEVPLEKIEDLASHTLIQVYPSEKDWHVWLDENKAEGIDPDGGLRFDSYDHALATAIRGMGVAMGMEPYVADDLEAGLLVCPFPEQNVKAHGGWYLVYPKGREKVRKIQVFRDWMIAEIQKDESLKSLRD